MHKRRIVKSETSAEGFDALIDLGRLTLPLIPGSLLLPPSRNLFFAHISRNGEGKMALGC